MTDIWQSIAARKEKLDVRDEMLRVQEDEAREAKKANRPSPEIAKIRRERRHAQPKRLREPKLYGRRREHLAIEIERSILESLEARKNRIVRTGCTAVIEEIRASRFVPKETFRERSDASEQALAVAIREIVDDVCDRLLAQFGEKPVSRARDRSWPEAELRALWRQRIALLNVGLKGAGREVAARELYDQDRGSLALYERVYHSNHLANQQDFESFMRFLRDDAIAVPAHMRAEAYRRGWDTALKECSATAPNFPPLESI